MGVARDVEKRLEGMVEGFFARVFRSGLQPVEIGKRILREMEEGRTVSVNKIYAPNEFRVSMGAEDYVRFGPMEAGLTREFSELIIDQAKTNRWNLMGLPRISFQEVERMGKGQFNVEASLAADSNQQMPRASTREPNQQDLSATRAVSSLTADRLGMANERKAELVVLDERGEAKDRISITKAPVSVGRMSTNDIVLSDSNVSRRHAELRNDGGRWTVADLGSTNGTLVNGKLAKEHQLNDGDKITFGTSELMFKSSASGAA